MTIPAPTWTLLAVVVALSGCATERRYPPPSLPESARLVEIGTDAAQEPAIRQASAVEATARPKDILVLSGGGMYGAYTAGVLKGWVASGRRPRFDVVTGVSTGVLIAVFAFLGPEFDDVLERGYTSETARDLFSIRLPPALFWSDSLVDAQPLRKRVKAEITPDVIDRVARAHAEGRRLYVGTTDLDTKRLVIWDMGAIAASTAPRKAKLFRDVLLASCAIPGLLPPVSITIEVDGQRRTELHVDGGVSASLFLPPSVLAAKPDAASQPGLPADRVAVIVAGKLQMASKPVERRLTRVSEEALSMLLQSRMDSDLLRVYSLTQHAGARFRLTAVPDDLPVDDNWMALDVPALKRIYAAGYLSGGDEKTWRTAPPALQPGDQAPPRRGVRFVVTQ